MRAVAVWAVWAVGMRMRRVLPRMRMQVDVKEVSYAVRRMQEAAGGDV